MVATISNADGIGEGVFISVLICYLSALPLAVSAIVHSITGHRHSLAITVAAALLAIYPAGFTIYLYRLDYPDDLPPFSEMSWWGLPLFMAITAGVISVLRRPGISCRAPVEK